MLATATVSFCNLKSQQSCRSVNFKLPWHSKWTTYFQSRYLTLFEQKDVDSFFPAWNILKPWNAWNLGSVANTKHDALDQDINAVQAAVFRVELSAIHLTLIRAVSGQTPQIHYLASKLQVVLCHSTLGHFQFHSSCRFLTCKQQARCTMDIFCNYCGAYGLWIFAYLCISWILSQTKTSRLSARLVDEHIKG